jgi:hypothetical protein
VTTDSAGQYSQSLDANANWQIKPHKSGDRFSAITAFDATVVLQAVTGSPLTSEQRLACDTNGSGTLTAFDASHILQFRVGLVTNFIAATNCQSDWLFPPNAAAAPNQVVTPVQLTTGNCQMGAIDYAPLAGAVSGQDFHAVLIGDCNGSWALPAGGGAARASTEARLRFGRARTHGQYTTVPVVLSSRRPLSSFSVDIAYDAKLGSALGARRPTATRDALLAVNSHQPGLLRIALAAGRTFDSSAEVLLLRFASNNPAALRQSLRIRSLAD